MLVFNFKKTVLVFALVSTGLLFAGKGEKRLTRSDTGLLPEKKLLSLKEISDNDDADSDTTKESSTKNSHPKNIKKKEKKRIYYAWLSENNGKFYRYKPNNDTRAFRVPLDHCKMNLVTRERGTDGQIKVCVKKIRFTGTNYE